VHAIEIIDEQTIEIDHHRLRDSALKALAAESITRAELSVVLLDNAAIHEWNRKALDHDFATDVITFSLADRDVDQPGNEIEGEILISVEMAEELASQVGWTTTEECILYLVHGILHLTGYDDQTEDDFKRMKSRERELLTDLGLTPAANDDRWTPV